MLIAIMSWKGAPGVTTTSLALTTTWTDERQVLLAECEPAGGEILAGYAQGQVPADRGLLQLVLTARIGHTPLQRALGEQLIALDESHRRWLLPGTGHPQEADAMPWDHLAALFSGLEHCDVIADCGRWGAQFAPAPLLRAADLTVLLVPRAAPAVWAVRRAAPLLREDLEFGDGLVAVTAGTAAHGHSLDEIDSFLRPVGIPVIGQIGYDPRAAAVFSDGADAGRWWRTSRLVQDAQRLGEVLRERAARRRARVRHGVSAVQHSSHSGGGI